jgi:serine/threonine-protein kinase
MPYIAGSTLRERLDREGELPIRDAVRLISEIAEALAFAHSKGVVHRDIKPDNVMLTGPHAIVADFGVAKAVSAATGRDKLTTVGVALGTPAYMSPEQATGDVHVDHRADIYALGVMAYELLTGRPPFTAATPQAVLAAHVTEEAEPVRKYRRSISAELDAVIMRCLAKRPADRWQSVDEMLPYLDASVTPSGGLTPTDVRLPAVSRGRMSRRAMLASACILAVSAGALGVWQLDALRSNGPVSIEQIAVLPLTDHSQQDELFVNTLVDALNSAIFRNAGVRVVNRSDVLRVAAGSPTTAEIASALSAQGVLEGSVFRTGTVMRINVQVVEPATLGYIWTGEYERDVTDVLGAQDELARTIAAELGEKLAVRNGQREP